MATTTSSGQAHYVEFDEYVDSKIAKTRETIRSTDIMVALVASAAAVLGYLLLFVIADHWLGMDFVPPLGRLVLGCSILGGSIVWAIWRIGLPNRRRINRLYVAREIEQHESALEGNLLNLVDLQQADRRIGLPVMRSIEKRAAVGLSKTDLDGTVDRSLLMRSSYTLLALVVAACLYTLLTVSLGLKPIGSSLMRAFGASATAPTRIQFESVQTQIADGDSFVDADSAPRVPARFQPMIQATLNKAIDGDEHVTLYFTTADQRFVDEPLEMRPVEGSLQEVYPEYSVTLLGENERGLLQDLTFRIEAGDAVTPNYSIQVSTAPSATVVSVDYDFPDYMRLEDESRDSPNIEGWEGTNVTVHAKTSLPVKSARLVFSDTEDTSQRAEDYPMHVTDGTKLSVAWHLAFRDGDPENYPKFYRIVCRDEQGATDLHPTLHSIAIRPDLPPEIELLDPRRDLTLPANAVLPLLVKARDPDFQLKHLTLRVELDGKQLVEHNRELFVGEQPSFGPQSVEFPLEPLGLQPGQTISYWIEARDNKMPLGNRANTAPKLNILITEPVSPEEARKQQQQRKEQQDEQVRQDQEEQDKQEQDGQDQDDQPNDQPPESGDSDARPLDPDTKPETNPDGKTEPGESPSDRDDQPDQQSGKPKPGDDTNDSPNEQGSDKPGDQDGGNAGDQKNEQNKTKNSDSSENPPNSSSSPQDGSPDSTDSKPGSGNPDPNAEPLNNDGSDDAEALDRVREFQSKQDDKTSSGETPDSDPNGQDPKPKPGDDNNTSSAQNSKSKTDPNTPADSNNKTGNQPDKKANDPKNSANRKTPNQEPGSKPKSMPPDKNSKDNGAAAQQKDNKQNKTGDADSKSNSGPSGKKNNTDTKKGERGTEPDGSKSQPKTGKGNPTPKKGQESSAGSKTKKGAGGKKGEGTPPDGKPGAADKTKGGSDQKPGTAKTGSASDGDDPKKAQSGDTKSKDGNKTSGNKKPGNKNNGKKGDTSSAQKNGAKDAKPNGKNNKKSGKKKDGQGGAANKPGGKTGGKPSNKPGSKGGPGNVSKNAAEGTGGTAGKQSGNAQQGEQPGEQPNKDQSPASSSDDPDPVNQEFTKEAANLVLKRLEDEINRGDVDPELLKQLGWTKEDVSKFAARLRDSVDTPDNDNSPESQAKRRQFQNLLKDIGIKSNGSKRTGRSQRTRKTTSINTQDIPVPLQFREAAKLYRRNLTSRRTRTSQRPRTTKPATSGN